MKTIGLIGGMSWESSVEYYRIINEEVKLRLGGTHSAKSIMYSVDFYEVEELQHKGNWKELEKIMIHAAKSLEKAGADFIVICTNTMHKMADTMEKEIQIPILHIADATADKIKSLGFNNIGLLGTKFTMEQNFYKGRLIQNHNLDIILPNSIDRNTVHRIIYDELVLGKIEQKSKSEYLEIIEKLKKEKAEGVILGCTEIGLLVKQVDTDLPLFDTTEIHAIAAVDYALEE